MQKLAIIYGSGASHDSKYEIIISNNNEEIKFQPPMDNNFFSSKPIQLLLQQDNFYALKEFIRLLFPISQPQSLEELWTSVAVNTEQYKLNTYFWKEEFNQYYLNCILKKNSKYPFNDLISTDITSIESGSLASSKGLMYNPDKFLNDCTRDLKMLIYKCFSKITLSNNSKSNYEILHKKIIKSNSFLLGHITFNYDLTLENSLEKNNIPYRFLGVNDSVWTDYFEQRINSDQLILKLHGSLGWKNIFNCTDIEFDKIPIKPEYAGNSFDANEFIEPGIVPPTIFKEEINSEKLKTEPLTRLLLNQWRNAINLLVEADKVIIIGYSFPLTDFHVHRIFQIANMIKRNKNMKEQKVLFCTGPNENIESEKVKLSKILQVNLNSIRVVNGFTNSIKNKLFDQFLDI
jgi:hypothetical protein